MRLCLCFASVPIFQAPTRNRHPPHTLLAGQGCPGCCWGRGGRAGQRQGGSAHPTDTLPPLRLQLPPARPTASGFGMQQATLGNQSPGARYELGAFLPGAASMAASLAPPCERAPDRPCSSRSLLHPPTLSSSPPRPATRRAPRCGPFRCSPLWRSGYPRWRSPLAGSACNSSERALGCRGQAAPPRAGLGAGGPRHAAIAHRLVPKARWRSVGVHLPRRGAIRKGAGAIGAWGRLAGTERPARGREGSPRTLGAGTTGLPSKGRVPITSWRGSGAHRRRRQRSFSPPTAFWARWRGAPASRPWTNVHREGEGGPSAVRSQALAPRRARPPICPFAVAYRPPHPAVPRPVCPRVGTACCTRSSAWPSSWSAPSCPCMA